MNNAVIHKIVFLDFELWDPVCAWVYTFARVNEDSSRGINLNGSLLSGVVVMKKVIKCDGRDFY